MDRVLPAWCSGRFPPGLQTFSMPVNGAGELDNLACIQVGFCVCQASESQLAVAACVRLAVTLGVLHGKEQV